MKAVRDHGWFCDEPPVLPPDEPVLLPVVDWPDLLPVDWLLDLLPPYRSFEPWLEVFGIIHFLTIVRRPDCRRTENERASQPAVPVFNRL